MEKEWIITRNKAIINFSNNYCKSEVEVLDSDAFRSVLEHYIKRSCKTQSKILVSVNGIINNNGDMDVLADKTVFLFKQLLVSDSLTVSKLFDNFKNIYVNRKVLREYVEEIYGYWRSLERFALLNNNKLERGILNTSFIDAKESFDKLIITLYRKISNNISMTKPNVYRQLSAGTNAAMVIVNDVWKAPKEYEILNNVPFVKEAVLRAPFITYPKKNKRDGIFGEIENPFEISDIKPEDLLCFPIKVGKNLAYIYVDNDFLSHGLSLCNLFEIPRLDEIKDKKPDLLVVFGTKHKDDKQVSGYYIDEKNDLIVGYVSKSDNHDYFGYMKKIILTIHNILNIRNGILPIHGAMVKIELKNGNMANIVIVGDSGAGKSENIEAFRMLAQEHISNMTIVFDDMGSFEIKDGKIIAYGTEIGAFVRLDDLDPGYAFKELDRSIFMNPDKINARLITPVSEYEDVIKGEEVDFFFYANNYTVPKDESIEIIEDMEVVKDIFLKGRRMTKGTTTENGITESFFANPFGPTQMQKETLEIFDKVFDVLYENNKQVGVIYTQLGIEGMEKKGPRLAALNLFERIKALGGRDENI